MIILCPRDEATGCFLIPPEEGVRLVHLFREDKTGNCVRLIGFNGSEKKVAAALDKEVAIQALPRKPYEEHRPSTEELYAAVGRALLEAGEHGPVTLVIF